MNAFETNVLIYACDENNPARQRFALDLIDRTTDGVMPWQVACEFIAVSRKLAGQVPLQPKHGNDSRSFWARFRYCFPRIVCLNALVRCTSINSGPSGMH